MKTYQFKGLLQDDKWLCPAYVRVDDDGVIESISDTISIEALPVKMNVFAIPGFQNAHSHAFQYAMAGLAERHQVGTKADDFWSWRDAMYKLALSISPDDLEGIATQLYAEMLRHGYTNVAEFHYVHHDQNGKEYENLSEMGERLVKAAKNTGIGITLLPIFYQKGGFGKAATSGQKRFISADVDAYMRLFEASEKSTDLYENANIAIGMHSMRGVDPESIKYIAENFRKEVPFHIHISEQLKEIEDALAYLGKRPVEWMLDNVALSERFHFVHATHLVDSETVALAQSKTNVVLCPSTEGNLGDGIFPLKKFQQNGGNWSIGTDSHIGLNPFEELRILDYGQRLISHQRNTFTDDKIGDSGAFAIQKVNVAGKMAMGNKEASYFKVGEKLNAVLMDAANPLIACTSLENLLSTFVYATDISAQYGTIANGVLCVKNGQHIQNDEISANFIKTIKGIDNR
ncbi:formimidoylglutamate deiminase [Putridiphycobacter roseus]|uniref:Formimidoylglutamate deiminase n=1 Tax=Putridiphycobacter roseus TaxID=2219161 RepID=A0A2W1N2D9_9FLAO|nr:formimidoylglutamate deiminase [Putridiphycobacter roseus]PZE17700.1 formimidoylglutamate deiminase [Putridiphycobacter roseus]